jgi:hypothetical protein
MATYSPIIAPTSVWQAVRPLGDLSTAEFNALVSAVSGPRSFSLSKEELEALRNQISVRSVNPTFLLAALGFLSSHVARLVESGVPYADAITAMTDELEAEAKWGEKKDEVRKRFGAILQTNEVNQRFRKVQRLQLGFMPNAVGFSTFVDLRPDFGDGEGMDIKGYVPVIQFRVTTDSSNPEEKRLIFQMNEESLVELRKTVDRTEAKLKALKEQPAIALQLIKM